MPSYGNFVVATTSTSKLSQGEGALTLALPCAFAVLSFAH